MEKLLSSQTASGVYDSLKRAAATVGLNLTLEAHAYLNQADDDYLMADFLGEKIRTYGSIEDYMATIGAGGFGDIEEKMSGALAINYFYSMPVDRLKKCVEFLGCHSNAGRTILEKTIVRAAREALAVRLGGMNLVDRGLRVSLIIFALASYTGIILRHVAAAIIFAALAALDAGILIVVKRLEKREYLRMIVKGAVPQRQPDPTLRTSIAEMLDRFYPGFDWLN